MNSYTRLYIFLAAFVLATTTVLATFAGKSPSAQPLTTSQETEQIDAPIAHYQSEGERRDTNSQLSPERIIKNRLYDKTYTVEELPVGMVVTPRSGDWVQKVPAIPVAQSDIIVIGHVTLAEAFLSNDQTGIYSEFTILVDQVLKNDDTRPFINGGLVIAERAGGAVQFPSGRIQRVHVFSGQRMPLVGNKYVLFLKQHESGVLEPTILTGYELRQGSIGPLDSVKPYSEYNGVEELRFLNDLRIQIVSAPKKREGGRAT